MSQVTKKNILSGISIFIAIMTLVALAFPVIVGEAKLFGVSLAKVSESGFDFLSFESRLFSYDWAITLIGVLCLMQLIVSIVLIGVNAISIFMFDEHKAFKFSMATVIVCCILNFMYLIEGCVAAATYNDSSYYTLTYIALILNLVFTFAYIGFVYYTKNVTTYFSDNFGFVQPQNTNSYVANSNDFNTTNKNSNVDLLIKYKQLLDDGIITQEEFEQKKSKLL